MASRIFPPPTSLVLVGMSGFWGSEPFVVMIALESPAGASSPPPVLQPDRMSAPAAARAMAATPNLLVLNVPPVKRASPPRISSAHDGLSTYKIWSGGAETKLCRETLQIRNLTLRESAALEDRSQDPCAARGLLEPSRPFRVRE